MATTENGIYYPNDGTKAADVLADLKTMAESIDKNIKENKYDDTEIKKDISDIKKEQETQNTDIENLQTNDNKQDELISKLKNALINAETEESKSLYVTDANKFGQLEVLGNQEQETSLYSGNLERGSISESGTVDASNRIRTAEYIEVRGNTEINVSADGANEYLLAFYNSNKEYIQSSPWANLGTSTAIIANSQFVKVLLRKTDNSSITVSDVSNFIVGPTPSSNYPSKVKCLGSNKNIFDGVLELGNIDTSTGQNSEHFNIIRSKNYNELNGEKEVTVTGIPNFYFFTYTEDKAYIESTYENPITIPENARYFKLRTWNSDNITDINTKIKVEEGDKATSYSPYGQGSTLISKINKNFYDKTNAIQRGLWGNNNSNSINTNYVGWYVIVKIIGGKTYTISRKNGEEENSYLQLAGTSTADFPANGVEMLNQWTQDLQNNGKKLQIQTAENANYLLIGLAAGQISEITEEVQTLAMEELMVNIEDTATDYIEHQQTDYLLYVQQEMLQGDYFIKESDGWKEVHNYPKTILTGTEADSKFYYIKNGVGVNRVSYNMGNGIKTPADNSEKVNWIYSNCFLCNNLSPNDLWNTSLKSRMSISPSGEILMTVDDDITSTSLFKTLLQEKNSEGNPIYFFAKTTTPTKLPCTEEQSVVLEELSNLDLFEGVNNIITAEDIALLKLKYALDVKTYVNNQLANVNQQILEIVGGN